MGLENAGIGLWHIPADTPGLPYKQGKSKQQMQHKRRTERKQLTVTTHLQIIDPFGQGGIMRMPHQGMLAVIRMFVMCLQVISYSGVCLLLPGMPGSRGKQRLPP